MASDNHLVHFLHAFVFFSSLSTTRSFVGVNYGDVANNLPAVASTVTLLQSTIVRNIRLYGASGDMLRTLARTGISIVIGVSNDEIVSLASGQTAAAAAWINSNVLPYPTSNITMITVGNEVLTSEDPNVMNNLLPAMSNVQSALQMVQLDKKIKVSTVHSMSLLAQSAPPSAGCFNSTFDGIMSGLLEFQRSNGSPFAINPYPFFAFKSNPTAETLAFCLFEQNPGRFDPNTKIVYKNMFDSQVDAVHSALVKAGYGDLEIMVAETGWPHRGDDGELGPNVENARAYNGNLIQHVLSGVGTPLMPGRSLDTYIFALYDENSKPGPSSERAFGLFNPSLSTNYDIGVLFPKGSANVSGEWCVAVNGVPGILDKLRANVEYACGQGIDCSATYPGGNCYYGGSLADRASYVMNLYYQTMGRHAWNCDFRGTAVISNVDPSTGECKYVH